MSTPQLEFFSARADEARRDANAATLDNVRQRCLRSAEAWDLMADRARRSERHRVADAERKAAALLMPAMPAH